LVDEIVGYVAKAKRYADEHRFRALVGVVGQGVVEQGVEFGEGHGKISIPNRAWMMWRKQTTRRTLTNRSRASRAKAMAAARRMERYFTAQAPAGKGYAIK